MTESPDSLRSKGSGLVLALVGAGVALAACGGSWLAFALVVNYVATTVSSAGAHSM